MNLLRILYLFSTVFQWNFVSGLVVSIEPITGPVAVNEGSRTELKCAATCTTSCAYLWNGPETSSSSTLTILSVLRSYKHKMFTCTVTDTGDGNKKSASKSFDVSYGPDTVNVTAGTSLTVIEGDMSDGKNLLCKAYECNPSCDQFKWTKDGLELSSSSKLFPTNRKILRSDAGSYTCTAGNGRTQNKSAKISIKVHYAPTVTLTWDGDETLKCKATGIPANYTFENMKQFVGSDLVKSYGETQKSGDTATFLLENKNYQNTGSYECYASNGIKNYLTGSATQKGSTSVHVKDLPVLISSEESYNVSKGDAFAISMTLYSYPEANESFIVPVTGDTWISNQTLEWKIENVHVKFHEQTVRVGGQRLNIWFSEVLEDHFTTFTVYIGNTEGNISTNVTIFPEGPPDIPTSFSKSEISSDSVAFTLVTGFFNGAGQTLVVEHRLEGNQSEWFNTTRNYAGVEKGQRLELVVTDLTPETVYEFRAYAYNEYNRSGYTDIIKETTEVAPISTAVIVGIVTGSIVFALIVAAIVVLIVRCRGKPKDIDGGTYKGQNKDLTLEMPTSPVYENNSRQNVYTGEPTSPDTPSTTCIYENTKMTVGYSPHTSRTNKTGPYDSPPSNKGPSDYKKELYDRPRSNAGPIDSSRSNEDLYDNTRLNAGKKAYYDSPRPNAGPFDSSQSKMELYDNPRSDAGKKVFYDRPRSNAGPFDSSQSNMEFYDNPRSSATETGGYRNDKKENGETVPGYLDLNNPQTVEEAYLDVNQSKELLQKSNSNSRLTKRGTVSENDYLDMNEVKEEVKKSSKSSKQKESPYDNAQKVNAEADSGIGEDYQNVTKYKKNKGQSAKENKPNQNMDAAKSKREDAAEEELKDYQNVNKFKQQASVESNSELYVAMSVQGNRQSVVSMPEYHAPPPPVPVAEPLEEENYMNIRMGKPK